MLLKLKTKTILLCAPFFLIVQCVSAPRHAVVVNRPIPPLSNACLHFVAEGKATAHDRTFIQAMQSGLRRETGVEIPLCADGKNEGGSVIEITYKLQLSAQIITKFYGTMYEYVHGTRIDYDILWMDGNNDALAYKNFSVSKTKEIVFMRYDVEPPVSVVQRAADTLNQLITAVNRPNDGFRGTWRSIAGDEEYEVIYNTETARYEGIQKKPDIKHSDAVVFWFTLDADQKEEKDGVEAWGTWINLKESKNSTKENPVYDSEELDSTLSLEGQLLSIDVNGPFAIRYLYNRDLIKVKKK